MKKFFAAMGLFLVLPCFAEVAPVYFDDAGTEYYMDDTGNLVDAMGNIAQIDSMGNIIPAPEDTPEEIQSVSVAPKQNPVQSGRATTSRSATRVIPATVNNSRLTTQRAVANRSISSRTPTVSRGSDRQNTTAVAARKSNINSGNVARSATYSPTTDTSRAATTAGTTSTAATRVGVRSSTASRLSAAKATPVATTETTLADTVSAIDELAQMTDFCKAQYTACMDQYCDILDENQGRCSCSKNIENYSKTEQGLKDATTELQSVAQKIQYIGLQSDEVESLFTQTEAEEAMQGKTDTSQLKNDLDNIKSLIIDVKTGTSRSTSGSLDLSSLLDFNFSGSGFDLSSFLGTGNVNSISNQRGQKLYDTAASKCKTSVLNECEKKGVNTAIITNSYDLEIDKQCLIYEKELVDSTTDMKRTVSNAQVVLQKARLLVAQQKNSYDLKGCITALDECMQDDFVCGDDYEGCLDPTGKYIVNGDVVVGSEPGVSGGDISPTTPAADVSNGLYAVWNYNTFNTWGNGTIDGFISEYIADTNPVGTNIVGYLQQKIGYHDNDDDRDYGMCVSVLNKCQKISYDTNGDYQYDNKVIEGYLQRTLTQIKAAQDEVLADYAEDCISDVTTCLSNNEYDEDSSLAMSAAKKACSAVIRTCASVTGNSENAVVASAVSLTDYSDQYSVTYELNNLATWATNYTYTGYYDINFTYILPSVTDTAVINITDTTCVSGTYAWYDAATGGSTVTQITANPTGNGGNLKFYLRCVP